MTNHIDKYIDSKINLRKEKNSFRTLLTNKDLIDFCSNDYLGMARDKDIHKEVNRCLEDLNLNINGSTGARTITGTTEYLTQLESEIAKFHKAPAALFYNSGYTANLGLFSALPYRGDTVVYDELIHASIRDGIGLSKSKAFSFKHNDIVSLEQKLSKANGNVFVVVESVYSMDGDMAPLLEIQDLCTKYDAALVVDEAHSNGIFGKNGKGLVVELGLERKVFARIMTFGKALGCHGAVILGNQNLKDFLVNYSRPFIYTTAPAPQQVLGVKIAYDNLSRYFHKILKLKELISLFKQKIKLKKELELIESDSPIQCIIIPGNDVVKRICAAIQSDGFDVRPIVAPTVAEGKERIRICLHAYNTSEQINGLVKSIHKNSKPN